MKRTDAQPWKICRYFGIELIKIKAIDGNVSILCPFTDDDLGRLFFGFKSSVLLRTGAAPLLLLRLRRLRRWWGSLHGETGILFSQRVSTGVGRWETGDPLYFIWMSGMADIFFLHHPRVIFINSWHCTFFAANDDAGAQLCEWTNERAAIKCIFITLERSICELKEEQNILKGQ